ncbi:MAG: hypothetical protein MI723_05245 [Caulobacterales bacterium]|nr:hypothetical protein [Caulobacterales bacterium]
MKALARPALIAALFMFVAPVPAADVDEEADPFAPLSNKELHELFDDASLRGCYNDRTEAWAERTAKDGRLFDNLQGGLEVGEWWIEDDIICYIYDVPEQHGPHCFHTLRRGPYFDFYSLGSGLQIASTQCEDEPTV